MALLREHRAFRRLWAARVISFVGDALLLVALIVHISAEHDEGFAVAALLLAGDFLPTLAAPWTATLADRVDKRRLMVTLEIAQGVVIVAMLAALQTLPLLLALVAVRSLLAGAFQPASQSAVPQVVADEDLETANSLLGLGTFGLEAVGAAFAAGLIAVVGTSGALAADAVSFGISALVLTSLPSLPPSRTRDSSVHRDALDGLRELWRDRFLRTIAFGFALFVAFVAMDDIALAFLARDELHAGDGTTALLYAGSGVGLFLGFLLLARRRVAAPVRVFVAGLAITAAGNIGTGLAWAAYGAFALQVLRGVGTSAVDVGATTLMQRGVPRERLGRAFGNLYGLIGLAAGVSYFAGGALLAAVSARGVLVIAGAGGLVAALWTGLALARISPSEFGPAER
jgi:MFS family permease